jgi:glutathione reductase (NADPH)
MSRYDFDFFTIGAGSGGVRASRFAAGFGAKAAVAEEKELGGTCVNVGCIPKKLLAYAAHYSHDARDSQGFGWSGEARKFDWPRLIANKNTEIERLNGVYARLLESSGVELVRGRAVLVDPHTVEVNGKRYTAENILVATGGHAVRPDIPGAQHVITSDEAFFLPTLPARALVVGAGYIAVEFASIFNGLGSEVTLLHRGETLLKAFDVDLGSFLAQEMKKQGVNIRLNDGINGVERVGSALHCTYRDGRVEPNDTVLFATGRAPNTSGLGLADIGVDLKPNGAIAVDAGFRTSVPSVYAVGDCIDRIQLTPVALGEAMVVAHNLFNRGQRRMDYSSVATAVFSDPNVATVGLSESTAKALGHQVDIFKTTFTPLKHTLSGSSAKVFLKLVVDKATDVVLGAHMVGLDAGETIQGIAIALKCGATKAQFDSTVGIHPTIAEEFVTMRQPAA